MSDSENKQDLGGLARSIGSLFSDPPSSAEDPAGAKGDDHQSGPAVPVEADSVDRAAPPEENLTPSPLEGGPEADFDDGAPPLDWDPEPIFDDATASPVRGEPDPDSGETEVRPPPVGTEPPLEDDPRPIRGGLTGAADGKVAALGSAGDLPFDSFETLDAVADTEAAVPVSAASAPSSAEPPVGADSDAPGPMDDAVAAFLAGGDPGPVRAQAEHHRDAREYDVLAAAAERLALAGGRRSDRGAVALAEELLTPIVLSRFVQRLGPAREPSRKAEYHEICRTLGPSVAAAIRDELAETEDLTARRGYVQALAAMGDIAWEVVSGMLDDENRFLARNAISVLGEMGGERAEELIVAGLANSDPRVRKEALHAIGKLRMEDAAPLVMGMLDDAHPKVYLAAVKAAGQLKIERAARSIMSALDDKWEAEEVLPLIHALGQIGDPGAVGALERHAVRERFGPPRTEVRIAAYEALNLIGTPHARRLVNQARDDRDPEVKAAAKQLLHV